MALDKNQIPVGFYHNFNRGIRLLKEGKEDEAEDAFDKCARDCPEAWLGMASEDMKAGYKQQAIKRFEQVLEHATHNRTRAVALNNLGAMLSNSGARTEAEPYFRKAFAEWKTIDAAVNIALSCMYRHQVAEARQWINKALMLKPGDPQALFNSSLIDLRDGDLINGFQKYESRFQNPAGKIKKLCVFRTEWMGQPIKDKTLFIYAEQGVGDTIQMLRYGPIIKPMVGRLLLATQKGIKDLAHRQDCWDHIYEDMQHLIESAQLPHWDFQLPMMSIPRVLKTTLNTIPPAPYLNYGGTGEPMDSFNIGFVWAGSLTHADDVWRSTKLEQWEPLFGVKGVKFWSFQIGPRTLDAIGTDYPIIPLADKLKTYDDTARYIQNMDLIISVDTSLVHLAGALGKPVWMLTPFSPDWRWMYDRQDSPWYPSLKLFRQTKEREWCNVFQRVKRELEIAVQRSVK